MPRPLLRTAAHMGLLSLLFGCDSSAPYRKKDGAWYFKDRPLSGAPRSVTAINATFARNNERVWYRASLVPNADAATFVALDDHYAKDVHRVYYCDTYRKGQEYWMIKHDRTSVLAGADAATFTLLGMRYARDDVHVYYEGNEFTVSDARTFEPLDYGFARDAKVGYYHQAPIPESDGSTFAVLDPRHVRDAKHAFFVDTDLSASPPVTRIVRLAEVDLATLTPLQGDYAKDATHVFFRGKAIKGADAASFQTLEMPNDSGDARDAHAMYKDGKRR